MSQPPDSIPMPATIFSMSAWLSNSLAHDWILYAAVFLSSYSGTWSSCHRPSHFGWSSLPLNSSKSLTCWTGIHSDLWLQPPMQLHALPTCWGLLLPLVATQCCVYPAAALDFPTSKWPFHPPQPARSAARFNPCHATPDNLRACPEKAGLPLLAATAHMDARKSLAFAWCLYYLSLCCLLP